MVVICDLSLIDSSIDIQLFCLLSLNTSLNLDISTVISIQVRAQLGI